MKKNYFLLSMLLSFSLFYTGCAGLWFGAGIAGTVAVSSDSSSGSFDADFATIWFKAGEALSEVGEIISEDEQTGVIIAQTPKGTKITINIERITDNTTKLKVKARRKVLPRLKEAQKIFNTIVRRL